LQREVEEWSRKNFGNQPSHLPLLGAVEEIGELAHAHLKAEQNIRTNEDHSAAKIDAVADAVIYLADYCAREHIDMQSAVTRTWGKVRQRDWKKNPEHGVAQR